MPKMLLFTVCIITNNNRLFVVVVSLVAVPIEGLPQQTAHSLAHVPFYFLRAWIQWLGVEACHGADEKPTVQLGSVLRTCQELTRGDQKT